jgi:peptidoglycan/LPS O-acetylase OafA/YrhL
MTGPRLLFLDLTKGALVLLMIAYHGLNYTNQYYLSFRYLSFLPPSFILITGFLVTQVYMGRFRSGDSTVVRRLIIRGVKLILLFTALNVAAQFVRSPVYGRTVGITHFFELWPEIYFLGSGRAAAFEILLPIAYLLLFAPIILTLTRRHARFLPAFAGVLLLTCVASDCLGSSNANLKMFSAGVLGMLAGGQFPAPETAARYLPLWVLAFAAYVPVGMTRGSLFVVQLFGAIAGLLSLLAMSWKLDDSGWWQRRVIRLGQYSLLAYIVQIAVLQALSRFVGRPDPLSAAAIVLFGLTLVITMLTVEFTFWLRSHFNLVDRTYKIVLG